MEEIWKDVVGYNEQYQISNTGKVKSYFKTTGEKFRKIIIDKDGYGTVNLYYKNKGKQEKVHRLVSKAYIPNPDNLPEVNHKDGDKSNNNDWNLEWCTSSYNQRHALDNKLKIPLMGEKHSMSKLKECDVLYIRSHMNKFSQKELSMKYDVSIATISMIISKKRWSYL